MSTGRDDRTGIVVDARGLRCPLPVIRLAQTARGLGPGTLLTLWSTDPAAEHDVPAWARMRGHGIAGTRRTSIDGAAVLVTTVRLGDPAPATAASAPETTAGPR